MKKIIISLLVLSFLLYSCDYGADNDNSAESSETLDSADVNGNAEDSSERPQTESGAVSGEESDDKPSAELTSDPFGATVERGDRVHLCCFRVPIGEKWIEQEEEVFAVDIDAEQFRRGDYNLIEAELRENVETATGKNIGDSFTVFFKYNDRTVFYRYTVLEIIKNSQLGNQKSSVEYGDSIRVSCKKAERTAEYNEKIEYLGGAVLKVDGTEPRFIESDAIYPEIVASELAKKVLGKNRSSSAVACCDEQYEYIFHINMVNMTVEPSYSLPEGWNYRFGPSRIGSFKGYDGESAGAIDMNDGDVFGYDDRLTLGCSAWCGCIDYVCEVSASSVLADQGKVSYAAFHLAETNRENIWAEGVEGVGIGESVEIKQMYMGSGKTELTFNSICIVNGYAKNETKWQENGRVKSLKLYYEGVYMGLITLEDTMNPQYIDISAVQMRVGNGFDADFRFEIAEVYEGSKYDDTCLTGIVIDFEGIYAH